MVLLLQVVLNVDIVKVGDEVEIVGLTEEPKQTTVTGVEMFRKILDEGEAGDNIGAILTWYCREEIQRGQVFANQVQLLHTLNSKVKFMY